MAENYSFTNNCTPDKQSEGWKAAFNISLDGVNLINSTLAELDDKLNFTESLTTKINSAEELDKVKQDADFIRECIRKCQLVLEFDTTNPATDTTKAYGATSVYNETDGTIEIRVGSIDNTPTSKPKSPPIKNSKKPPKPPVITSPYLQTSLKIDKILKTLRTNQAELIKKGAFTDPITAKVKSEIDNIKISTNMYLFIDEPVLVLDVTNCTKKTNVSVTLELNSQELGTSTGNFKNLILLEYGDASWEYILEILLTIADLNVDTFGGGEEEEEEKSFEQRLIAAMETADNEYFKTEPFPGFTDTLLVVQEEIPGSDPVEYRAKIEIGRLDEEIVRSTISNLISKRVETIKADIVTILKDRNIDLKNGDKYNICISEIKSGGVSIKNTDEILESLNISKTILNLLKIK